MADASSVLGAYSGGEQANRLVRGNQTQNFDQLMLQAEAASRAAETDALRKLAVTDYLKAGGNAYQAPTITMQGQQKALPTFGWEPKGVSPEVAGAASGLEGQLISRMQPGGTYMPTPLDSYADRGLGEKIGNIGGLITGGLGALDTITGGNNPISRWLGGVLGGGAGDAASSIGGLFGATPANITSQGVSSGAGAGSGLMGLLGKAAPIAGIGAGALGLMKDRGWAGNMASGASTGAGIGSLIAPGIGTVIGGGIGALGGLLRGIGGGPSEEELAGRETASLGRQMITRTATPQQVSEAQMAGWENPQDALTMIVLRDRFGEQAASQMMTQLHQAEKSGPQAVNSILSMLRG